MATIAIIGAAGRFGNAAAKAFVEAGWTVRGIGRGKRLGEMAKGVQPVEASAFNQAQLVAACAGADVVMNAANPPYDKWDTTVLPMARNALEAAKAVGATHLLPGNVYNFGREIGEAVGEDAPQIASTDKARIRIALEVMCRDYGDKQGVQTLILRAGDFYGGDRPGSWLDLMILKDLPKGKFTWPGPWELPHAFAYLPDLAKAFVQLADKRASLGKFERFHFAGHTLTGEQMAKAAEAAIGQKLKRANVNWTVLKLVGLFMPVLREVVKMNYLWSTAHSLDGSRFSETIAAPVNTPPAKALAEAIRALDLDGKKSQALAA